MIKRFLGLFLILLLSFSCSKYEIHPEKEIDIENLTYQNIKTDLDIIYLTADSADLAYMMAYPDIETRIDGLFYMFNKNGPIISNKRVEIKIKGSTTVWYDLKSLKIKFIRKVNNLEIPILRVDQLLPGHYLEELKKISLRNSGNDFYGTFIKDISYSELAIRLGLDLELAYYKPVQVFVNDKYYGLLNLRTEKDDNSLGKLLNVDNEDINILKISHLGNEEELLEVGSGDSLVIQELIDAVEQEDKEFLLNHLDLNCFADYIAFEDYIGNTDWPYNNVEIYNVSPGGKFRCFLYDLDFAADMDKQFMPETSNNGFFKQLYNLLLSHPPFEELLGERRDYIYEKATGDLFSSIIHQNANKIENEIIYNVAKYQRPENKVIWYFDLQELEENYNTRRKLFKWYYGY